MRLTASFVALALLLLAQGWASPSFAEPALGPDESVSISQHLLELTNQERASAGLPPLQWNDTLARDAASYALDMATRNYFSHQSLEGLTPVDRAWAAGYQPFDWGMFVGENLAKGYSTPEGVMQGWKASEAHYRNLLFSGYAEAGVGFARTPDGTVIWVEDFGNRPGTSVDPASGS